MPANDTHLVSAVAQKKGRRVRVVKSHTTVNGGVAIEPEDSIAPCWNVKRTDNDMSIAAFVLDSVTLHVYRASCGIEYFKPFSFGI